MTSTNIRGRSRDGLAYRCEKLACVLMGVFFTWCATVDADPGVGSGSVATSQAPLELATSSAVSMGDSYVPETK